MPSKIFWSWQSDRPGKVNRHFLKRVIEQAIERASDDLGLDERPEIDHDVQGTAGLVSIPETILKKIDEAAIFVADITPVAITETGKYVANPNVLIELGYAKKSLGPERIILVWNGAWGGCRPEDLPFDLRHRRAPFLYTLAPDAIRGERNSQGETLVGGLAGAISASLERVPLAAAALERIQARSDDPSVWFDSGAAMPVNAGTSFGPDQVTFQEGSRAYIRIAPAGWTGESLDGVRDGRPDLFPLGDTSGLNWGRVRGGVICYSAADRNENSVTARTGTQWFQRTGEIWGFDSSVVFEMDERHSGLATRYILQCWQRFLRRHAQTFDAYEVRGPFDIEAGVTGIENLFWPRGSYDFNYQPAIEETLTARAKLMQLDESEISSFMTLAATQMRYAFGFGPFSETELLKILGDRTRQ